MPERPDKASPLAADGEQPPKAASSGSKSARSERSTAGVLLPAHPAASSTTANPAPVELVVQHQGYIGRRRRQLSDQNFRDAWIHIVAELADHTAVPPVASKSIDLELQRVAIATIAARAADLADYHAWRTRTAQPGYGIPATPLTVVAWIEDLAQRTQRPTTIARKVSSLSAAHEILGLDNPTKHRDVRSAMTIARRNLGTHRRQAGGVRLDDDNASKSPITLRGLLAACKGGDIRDVRDAALVSVAYDGGLRASEVAGVQVEHITRHPDGSGTLHIPRSKTDQEKEGAEAALSFETMELLDAWLGASAITCGTVFRRIARKRKLSRPAKPPRPDARPLGEGAIELFTRAGEVAVYTTTVTIAGESPKNPGQAALSRSGLAFIYRRLARRAADLGEIDAAGVKLEAAIKSLTTHGFRVGMAQDLVASRYDIGQIQLAMRWKSTTTALSYVREIAARDSATAEYLRNRRGRAKPA